MTKINYSKEQHTQLIHDMNELLIMYGRDPSSDAMELVKGMYLEDRITIDEFMTLIK